MQPHLDDFPLRGGITPANSALMVIDMQVDFCAPDGFVDRMGVDLAPRDDEAVFDKNAYGAFGSTAIHDYLRGRAVANLVITGVTTNCCIHSNLREALDRGYDCLVLEDCCGATSLESHERSMAMMRSDDGVFGAIAGSTALIEAIREPRSP